MAQSPFAGAEGPLAGSASAGANVSEMELISPTRSLQNSEAQLLQRCTAAVEQCRKDLADLRTVCKAANSHREKCAELLGAATEAVVALEDMLYDPDIDLMRERALQQFARKVQQSLDKGEAVVKVYGSMNGLQKLAWKICSPGTTLKFDEVIKELTNLAKQARLQRQQPASRMTTAGSTAMDSVRAPSSMPIATSQLATSASTSNQSTMLPSSPMPTSPLAHGSDLASAAPSGLPSLAEEGGNSLGGSQPQAQQQHQSSGDNGHAFMMGDRQVPEEAMHWMKIRKGGSRQAITSMVHVPPGASEQPGHLGYLWYYLSKSVFSNGTLFVYNLSNGLEDEVKEAREERTITCMHFDDINRYVWTGHSSGRIRVWSADEQHAVVDGVKVFSHSVSAITADELGRGWVGGDKGRVRCYRIEDRTKDGVRLGCSLVLRGELNTVGEGIALPTDYSAVSKDVDSMVTHPLAREMAHYGPVRSVAAAAGRVWTSGGSSAFATFKEWSQTGICVKQHSMRSMGLINAMAIVSPIITVQESQRQRAVSNPQVVNSFSATASVTVPNRVAATVLVDLDMPWQLVTAHDSGVVQVWGHIDSQGALQSLVRIGDRVAPALRLVVCEPLGAIITVHNDGKVRIRPIPHRLSSRGMKTVYQDGSTSHVKDANMPYVQLDASRSGLAQAVGGRLGVITASNSAAIKMFPVADLRRLAEDAGVEVQSAMADFAQWPMHHYTSFGLLQHVEQEAIAARESLEYEASLADQDAANNQGSEHGGMDHPLFLEETNKWLIDWDELTRTRIIGEGAFGKVWLGRWQETDVAIKQLGSLSALGVETGSLQHDSSGGVKLNKEVQKVLDKEVGLLKEMRHPNIILFMGVVLEPAAVVTEYCARGSLYDLLQEAREKPALKRALDWPRRIVMALDAAKGMLYLHGHKPAIIHRDLKSPNLLVEKNWRVKVTDFNLSKATTKNDVMSSVQATNPRWQPPEVILRQEYTKASDVYAFGLILWELLTWDLPFASMSVMQIMLSVTQQQMRPPVPDQYAAAQLPGGTFNGYDEYVDLMRRCWADDPQERPTFERVIADLRKIANILSHSRENPPRAGPTLGRVPSRNIARQSAAAAAAHAEEQPVVGNASVSTAAIGAQQESQQQQAQQQQSEAWPGTDTAGNISQQSCSSMVVATSGTSVMSGTPAPPSPFHEASAASTPPWLQQGTAVAAAAAGGQTVSSAAPPPRSPFDVGPAPVGGQTISSAAPPPRSPFDDGPASAGGQIMSSNAPPPRSPFDSSPAPAGGQTISSNAPPPPSPFGGGGEFAMPVPVAASGAAAVQSSVGRLRPYAARSPRASSPSGRHNPDLASRPCTVMEVTASMETAATASPHPPLEGIPAARSDSADHKSSGRMSSRRNSQLIDSALTAAAGHVPRGNSLVATAAQPQPAAPVPAASDAAPEEPADDAAALAAAASNNPRRGRSEGKAGLFQRLFSSGGSGRRLKRVQTN